MITPVVFYQASCDRCGYVDKHGDTVAWEEGPQAEDAALDSGWRLMQWGVFPQALVCPGCFYIDEMGEPTRVKPPVA